MGTCKKRPIHDLEVARPIVADLALVIQREVLCGNKHEELFELLCSLFDPLFNRLVPALIASTGVSLDDAQHELRSTLFESVLLFDWRRCRDANLFSYYVKKRMWFVTAWRVGRVLKDLPVTDPPTSTTPYHLGDRHVNEMLYAIEDTLGVEAADLTFCKVMLRMSQQDLAWVFGCSQQTISVHWNHLVPSLRELFSSYVEVDNA